MLRLSLAVFGFFLGHAFDLIQQPAHAHSWYPLECCHDLDCGPVLSVRKLTDGWLRIETARGVGYVPAGFAVRPSPDGRAHACLVPDNTEEEQTGWFLRCLFLPGVA